MKYDGQDIVKSTDDRCSYTCGRGHIYVSSRYGRKENGEFENIGFNDNVLETSDPKGLGFIISGGAWEIDHAPDAAHILFGLKLIPDDVDTVIAIDRRGQSSFIGTLLEPFIEGGACVLWDGMDELESRLPNTVIRCFRPSHSSWDKQAAYGGQINESIAEHYARALLCFAVDSCRPEYELQARGRTVHGGSIAINNTAELAQAIVRVLSVERDSFPPGRMNPWARQVVQGFIPRFDEVSSFECVHQAMEQAYFLEGLSEIWRRGVVGLIARQTGKHKRNGRYSDNSIIKAARERGIDYMVEALEAGVRAEDIVG